MKSAKSRRVFQATLLCALMTLLLAGYVWRGLLLEQWWIWSLDDPESQRRQYAAQQLGEMRSTRAATALIRALRAYPNDTAHHEALMRIGPKAARPSMALALEDKSTVVRRRAAQVLARFGATPRMVPQLRTALVDPDARVRRLAAAALTHLGPQAKKAVALLCELLDDSESQVRAAATRALAAMGVAAVPDLIGNLHSESATKRQVAAEVLGEIGAAAAAAVPSLAAALKDRHPPVSFAAAEALARLGPTATDAVDALSAALRTRTREPLRFRVVHALREIGAPAVPALIDSLTTLEPPIRRQAIDSLGTLGAAANAATAALTERLYDEHAAVRWSAAEALGKIGASEEFALQALGDLTMDRDKTLRARATEALQRLDRAPAAMLIARSPSPAQAESQPPTPKQAPALSVTDWIHGGPIQLQDGSGKAVYVIHFWRTWSPSSRRSIRVLSELKSSLEYANVEIVAITNENADQVRAFVAANDINYAVAIVRSEKTAKAYGKSSIPYCFVVDRQGNIVWNGSPLQKEFSQIVCDVADEKLDAQLLSQRLDKSTREAKPWNYDRWRDPDLESWTSVRKLVASGERSCWSPDGKRLAFSRPQSRGIRILDIESGAVTDLSSRGTHPAWSPKGRWIAFVDESLYSTEEPQEIWLVEATGGEPRQFVEGGFPRWSADGESLLFHSRRQEKLLTVRVDKALPSPTPKIYFASPISPYPAISPSGKYVACGDGPRLDITNRSTGLTEFEFPTPRSRGVLSSWSPDGTYLAYGGYDGTLLGVWLLDFRTRKVLQIADRCYTAPQWSPDGKRLSFDYSPPDEEVREVWVIDADELQRKMAREASSGR